MLRRRSKVETEIYEKRFALHLNRKPSHLDREGHGFGPECLRRTELQDSCCGLMKPVRILSSLVNGIVSPLGNMRRIIRQLNGWIMSWFDLLSKTNYLVSFPIKKDYFSMIPPTCCLLIRRQLLEVVYCCWRWKWARVGSG